MKFLKAISIVGAVAGIIGMAVSAAQGNVPWVIVNAAGTLLNVYNFYAVSESK